jgi:acylaminoacyl-peptidase
MYWLKLNLEALTVVTAASCLVSLSATSPEHQEKTDRLTATDIFNIQYAADPQISPDGKRVVYVRDWADRMTDKRCSNLWIIATGEEDDRPLTSGCQSDSSPRWSPDGKRIAFLSDREGEKTQLFVRWMDTGQTGRLTSLEFPPSEMAWSPDGKLICFVSLVLAEGPKIATLPKVPEGAKWADPPLAYDRLDYRFNGLGYRKPGFTQIFVISADGGAPRQLSTGDYPHGGTPFGGGGGPVWSPDGKKIIFPANLRPDYEYHPLDSEIYEVSIADGTVKQLTHRTGPDNAPAVSPDGKLIAYTGFDDRYQGHQTTHLYLMNVDGSNPRLVTASLDRDVQQPRWTPDGRGIVFMYDERGDTKLGLSTLDGQVRELTGHLGSGGSSYTGGAAFTLAKDGTFATTYDTPADPGDIAVGTLTQPQVRVLTALNGELFRQKKLGETEEFWFNSSKDQRRIQGWIIRPPDFDPAKKYPLMLEIHGGPFANYGDRFDTNKQIWAAMGYLVLYVNPRGSTSYGEEFGNLIHHAYPGDDFDDLNSGVDAAIAKGSVDTENLFVTGGSGGGVLTCWMVDRTERFRAAASLYPVINWYSWVLTSDLPSFGTLYWFPGPPWEHMEQYMKRSVLSYAGQVKTPTLLMTGEEDYRTPISEAEQFYAALKLRKIDTALVRFPGEPHGLSRRPSHQMAKVLYVAGWFELHKKKD